MKKTLTGYYADGRPKPKPVKLRPRRDVVADYLNWARRKGLAEVTFYDGAPEIQHLSVGYYSHMRVKTISPDEYK